MRAPRIVRSSASDERTRFRPRKSTSPLTILPAGLGNRPMIASAVTLLPLPDSPSTASVSDSRSEKETPSTALTTPARVWNSTARFRTSSKGSRGLFAEDLFVSCEVSIDYASCLPRSGPHALSNVGSSCLDGDSSEGGREGRRNLKAIDVRAQSILGLDLERVDARRIVPDDVARLSIKIGALILIVGCSRRVQNPI